MKKYLVIALDVANTAPGIVFQTLIRALSRSAEVTLMARRAGDIPLHGGVDPWHKAVRRWKRWGCNPKDILWARHTYSRNRKAILKGSYDAVITLTSNGYYSSLNLGKIIADSLGCKYIIYSVDGMPSPLPWIGNDTGLHSKISRQLAKLCDNAHVFVSSNLQMMEYQKQVLPAFRGRWDYLFTPYRPLKEGFCRKEHQGFNILYAGSLYGLRKIDGLLEAFRLFRLERPDARLLFVGETVPEYRSQASEGVVFIDPTDRIDDYYSTADCLIDIAADIPDDIFLSSKVICYLPYQIPILAISGENSPVSLVMGGVPSIAQCRNNAIEILQALRRLQGVTDFTDREALMEEFSPETVCEKFKTILES